MDFFPLAVLFLIPTAWIISSAYRKVKEREYLHRERTQAIDKGLPVLPQPVAKPEVEETVKAESRSRGRTPIALHGVIWASIGGGLVIVARGFAPQLESEDMREFSQFLGIWGIPALCVGGGLLIYSWFTGLGRVLSRIGRSGKRSENAGSSAAARPGDPGVDPRIAPRSADRDL